MRKTSVVLLSIVMVAGLIAGCGNKATKNVNAADGVYYAEGEFAEKSGWKEIVALQVEDGKIVNVNWNGLHKAGGLDKKTTSQEGLYGMVTKGGAQAEWHEQAAKMEKFLLEQQSTEGITTNDEGKTDAVTGVSIGVGEFSALVDEALKAGPVPAGPYKDGSYHVEAAEFDEKSGWKDMIHLTIMNGNIVAVRWNGVHKDGGTDKVTRSTDGEYGMVTKGGAQAEWHEQALKAEQYLLEKQDPAAIVFNAEDGKTDAITGVSVGVDGFVELALKALDQAKK